MSLEKSKAKFGYVYNIYYAALSEVLSRNFTDEERKKLGHSLDDIMFNCWFNGQPCGPRDFTWKFDRFTGNCFVFNSNNTKKSFISGGYYGLQLLFYVGFNENLEVFNSIYWRGGFAKVENASFLLDDTFDGISLAPGNKMWNYHGNLRGLRVNIREIMMMRNFF